MKKKLIGFILALVILLLGGMAGLANATIGIEKGADPPSVIAGFSEEPIGNGLVAGVSGTEPVLRKDNTMGLSFTLTGRCDLDKCSRPTWHIAMIFPAGIKYLPDIMV